MKIIVKGIRALVTMATLFVILTASVFTVPRIFGYEPYLVKSGSMEPVIHTGAVAFINTRDRKCVMGDIITYQMDGTDGTAVCRTVTHRIHDVDAETGQFITKGDANDVADQIPVRQDQIIGTYGFQIPEVGFLLAGWGRKHSVVLIFWTVLLNVFGMVMGKLGGS